MLALVGYILCQLKKVETLQNPKSDAEGKRVGEHSVTYKTINY